MHHHSKHEDRKSFLAVEALREVMEREDRPISSSPEHPMKNTTPERTAKDYIDAFLDLDPQDDKSRMSALGGLFILAIEQGRQAGLAERASKGKRDCSANGHCDGPPKYPCCFCGRTSTTPNDL